MKNLRFPRLLKFRGALLLSFVLISPGGVPALGAESERTVGGEVPFRYGKMSFQIHGSMGELKSMNAIKEILERDEGVRDLLNYFRYEPRRKIHFFLNERPKRANGSASLFPHNLITLFDFPPLHRSPLAMGHRWTSILVIHELAHVIHMEQTRGLFRFLDSIFGAIVRPGAVVPRWVSEGLAVWAESRFTDFGRLKSILHQSSLYKKLKNLEGGAVGIGRLDHPGEYPFEAFPYWVGGFFMDDLERRRPGFIRCFVERNSARLPFFADGAFRDCGGAGVEALFKRFRRDFIKNYESEWGVKGPGDVELPHEDQISWFSGTTLVGTKLFYVFWEDGESFVGAYDGAHGSFRFWRAPAPVEHLTYAPLEGAPPSVNFQIFLRPSEEGRRRVYGLRDKEGGFGPIMEQRAPYEFHAPGGKVFFHYGSWRWTISNEGGGSISLPPGLWVFHPEMHGGRIFFKLVEERSGRARLVELDPSNLKMKERAFGLSSNTFFAGTCGPKLYLLETGDKSPRLWAVSIEGKPSSTSFELRGKARSAILIHLSDRAVFVLDRRGPRFDLRGCEKFLQDIAKNSKVENPASSPSLLPPHGPPWKGDSRYREPPSSRSFPSPGHFVPRYWFFASGSGDSPRTRVRTGLSDPLGRHSLDFDIRYGGDDRDIGGKFSYTFGKEEFFWGLAYEDALPRSFLPTGKVSRREREIFVGREWEDGPWLYRPGFSLAEGEKKLDSSVQREERYELFQELFWTKDRRHQFIDHLNLKFSTLYSRDPDSLQKHWALEMGVEIALNHDRRWRSTFRYGFSKALKDRIDTDSIFVGEGRNFHDFYGFRGMGIYGNELDSAGIRLYRRLARPYFQWGLVPLQWREIGGVLGGEYVRADRIVTDLGVEGRARSLYGGDEGQAQALLFSGRPRQFFGLFGSERPLLGVPLSDFARRQLFGVTWGR